MPDNESRTERKKEKNIAEERNKSTLNKGYYYVIAFLFLILFLLVIYIFIGSGDKVDLEENESPSGQLEETSENTQESSEFENDLEEENELPEEDTNEENEADEENEEESDTEEEDSEENIADESVVNEEAPHDEGHAIDFNDGSADRIAIKEEIMKLTGLESDLIEYWVGNDGPGRVSATVASADQSEIYEVSLQYGEGAWHVVDYQSLDSVPTDFN